MSLKWTRNQSDSGILRKNEFKEKKEELFVFGYSCKLFREDAKALHIDQGKHLIPWMGDDTLKIDRYDARGALQDLSSVEAPPGGYDWRVELNKNEKDVERLCDDERYRALHTDEDEEEMYREEELKRLHAAGYGQVGFNYETPSQQAPETPATENDEPFVPSACLKALLPDDIILPTSSKLNSIIDKTATFIATQGAQMEILLRAKQADNSQFQFLNKDSPLHPYYIALIGLVKAGKWPEKEAPEPVEEKHPEHEDYLHPSLGSTVIESAPSIPSIQYRPSADCDYTLLISKIKGSVTLDEPYQPSLAPGELPPPGTEPLPLPERGTRGAEISRPPVMYGQDGPHDAQATQAYYEQYQVYYQQYMAQVQAVQSLKGSEASEIIVPPPIPPPGVPPGVPPTTVPSTSKVPTAPAVTSVAKQTTNVAGAVGNPTKSTGLSLMTNYNTDSDSDAEDSDDTSSTDSKEPKPAILEPPDDIKIVVDKMAAYVARNGDEFADIVRAKNDPRFSFLEPTHEYHAFYLKLMREKRGVSNGDGVANKEKPKSKKTVAPVSFSIKKLKEPDPVLPKPALPYESSSEEESEDKQADKPETPTTETSKPTTPILPINNIPPAIVYKIEAVNNDSNTIKEKDDLKPKAAVAEKVIETTQVVNEKPTTPVIKEQEKETIATKSGKPEEERAERSQTPELKRDVKRSHEERRREKKRLKERKSEHHSKESRKRSPERERVRQMEKEMVRKKRKYKHEVEDEVISLEEDELIDLTGDQSDSTKAEADAEVGRGKQQERRRRAAEFLKKVGVDPSAAAVLPTSSLASAMVDTLETLRKKKAEEEERRRKREKRKRRELDEDRSLKKCRRRKYDNDDSDREGSKRKKRKRDKKQSKSKKKKRRERDSHEEGEDDDEGSQQDHPLSIDLTSTLKGLRTNSPTKELALQGANDCRSERNDSTSSDDDEEYDDEVARKEERSEDKERSYSRDIDGYSPEEEDDAITSKRKKHRSFSKEIEKEHNSNEKRERSYSMDIESAEDKPRRKKKKKKSKEEREYSEGEWSSDSEEDSVTSDRDSE